MPYLKSPALPVLSSPSLNRGQRQLPEESDLCREGSALPVLPDVEGNDQERKGRETARDFFGR